MVRTWVKRVSTIFLIFLMFLVQSNLLVALAVASPWSQTDWSTGNFSASSNVTTSTANQITLAKQEKLTNTGFETNLTGWTGNVTSFSDATFNSVSGAVAAWPLDDTTANQSYGRVLNPAVALGRNLTVNGTFDTDTLWSKGAGWTIGGGVATRTAQVSFSTLSQSITTMTQGRAYQAQFTISNYGGSGTINSNLGGTAVSPQHSGNGTVTDNVVNAGASVSTAALTGSAPFAGNIDDFNVNELTIPASTSNPSTIIADGDMEATGTTSWSTGNAAFLSKQDTAHGGTKVLRIARNLINNPNAFQAVMTTGNVYRAYGYARSDGLATPRLTNSTGVTIFSGTTSTAWQPFDFVFVADGANIQLISITSTGNQYTEWDDMVVSADNFIRTGELVQDRDMESIDTSNWASSANATLSKVTTTQHGGASGQVLQVAYNGSNSPGAIQRDYAIGKTYHVTGWFRGDGTFAPSVAEALNGGALQTGTSSTSWQFFDVTLIAQSTAGVLLRSLATSAGSAEFDDISATEIDPMVATYSTNASLRPVSNTAAGGHLTTAYSFNATHLDATHGDFMNLYSTTLNSAFSPTEGTMVAWAKVSGAGVWSDGAFRWISLLGTGNNNNLIDIVKNTTNNQVLARYIAGGTTKSVTISNSAPTTWQQYVITWSKSADQVKAYLNGVQQDSTQTGLGTWVGNLGSTSTLIGATVTTSGASPWSGLINDVRVYNRALSDAEILALYNGVNPTRDTSVKLSGTASAKVVGAPDENGTFTESVNVGDTNTYHLEANAYIDGSTPVTSSYATLWYNGAAVATTYTSVGGGWYKLTGTITGVASAVDAGVQILAGKTVYFDDMSLYNYPSSGTLTSSIFDSGQFSDWGTLTYAVTTPTNTTATVKVRTGNQADLSDATAFGSCPTIASGSTVGGTTCATNSTRYAQYLITLGSSDLQNTPTFTSFSLPFTLSTAPTGSISINSGAQYTNTQAVTLTLSVSDPINTPSQMQMEISNNSNFSGASYESFNTTKSWTLNSGDGTQTVYARFKNTSGNVSITYSDSIILDTTAPNSVTLIDPGDSAYTNNLRPSFKWKGTTDATSGMGHYNLSIDNPDLGSGNPSGDFTISNIPATGTQDIVTSKYVVHYENFNDSDPTNDTISVYTKDSPDWGPTENDGLLREGKVIWQVQAVDIVGNQTASGRTLFVDRTNPTVQLSTINNQSITTDTYTTTSVKPTFSGKVLDVLAGGNTSLTQTDSGPRVASGPSQIEVKVEKKQGLFYQPVETFTYHFDTIQFVCDGKITDNTLQTCDKYAPFTYSPQQPLSTGSYKFTFTGQDIAGNNGSSVLYLNVTTLGQIAPTPIPQATSTPAPTPRPGTVASPTPTVAPTLTPTPTPEVTLPVQPSIVSQMISAFGNLMANIVGGTTRVVGATTQFLASLCQAAGRTIQSDLALLSRASVFIGQAISGGYTRLLASSTGLIRTVLQTFGSRVQQICLTLTRFGQTTINTFNQTLASVFYGIGQGANRVSDQAGSLIMRLGARFITEPTQISQVQAVALSPTSVKISWSTNTPATSKVNWGYSAGVYQFELQSDKLTTTHEFTLTGLKPDTNYHYEVMSNGKTYAYDANRQFTTPKK